jgi:bifunctional non-homologous end joining protein LigD
MVKKKGGDADAGGKGKKNSGDADAGGKRKKNSGEKAEKLVEYKKKRDFSSTTEPEGSEARGKEIGRIFVVQEHHASHLHYDLRFERDGVLVSFAVPKGIPEKPGEKHLAVRTEDHPIEYADFEGNIPEGEYGAGEVKIWDRGLYEAIEWKENTIEVVMKGERLSGRYVLVRFRKAGPNEWLLFMAKD